MSTRYEILDSNGKHFNTHTSAKAAIEDVCGPRFYRGFWVRVGSRKKKFCYDGDPAKQIQSLLRWKRTMP